MPSRPGSSGTSSSLRSVRVFHTRCGIPASKPTGASTSTVPAPVAKLSSSWSAVEDLLQVRLDVVFVDALRQRQLLDEEVARGVEHLALTKRKVLVELEQVEVAQHFRDLEHGARLDLLHVLAVPAVPGGGIDRDILLLQDAVHFDHGLLVDQVPQADRADLVDGDEDLHPVFHDLEHVERLPLTGDVLVLDPHHFPDSLPRVDGLVADLERLHTWSCITALHPPSSSRLDSPSGWGVGLPTRGRYVGLVLHRVLGWGDGRWGGRSWRHARPLRRPRTSDSLGIRDWPPHWPAAPRRRAPLRPCAGGLPPPWACARRSDSSGAAAAGSPRETERSTAR